MAEVDYAHLRNQEIPSWTNQDDDDPYAMIFVVNDTKNELGELPAERDVLQASSLALTKILLDEDELTRVAVATWMSGRIRKIVKRARNSAWDKTANTAVPFVEAEYNSSKVRVFAPVRLSEQPAELKKLQVTGLQSEDLTERTELPDAYLAVSVPESLNMSTGKLVAQVGHAVQLFFMYANDAKVQAWVESGLAVTVKKVSKMPQEEEADAVVHDAGFTEVPAGSLTATAVFQTQ